MKNRLKKKAEFFKGVDYLLEFSEEVEKFREKLTVVVDKMKTNSGEIKDELNYFSVPSGELQQFLIATEDNIYKLKEKLDTLKDI